MVVFVKKKLVLGLSRCLEDDITIDPCQEARFTEFWNHSMRLQCLMSEYGWVRGKVPAGMHRKEG